MQSVDPVPLQVAQEASQHEPLIRTNEDSQVVHPVCPAPLHVKQVESQEEQAPLAKYSPETQEVQSEDVAPLQVKQEESHVIHIPELAGIIVVPVPQSHG